MPGTDGAASGTIALVMRTTVCVFLQHTAHFQVSDQASTPLLGLVALAGTQQRSMLKRLHSSINHENTEEKTKSHDAYARLSCKR